MKHIQKNITPEARQALATFIRKENKKAHYDNFKQSDGKNAVQESLLREQGFLCAYCMRRIQMSPKIEHWVTREQSNVEKKPHQTLNYNNLLAVCIGTTLQNEVKYEHCDQSRSKSNRELTINPTDERVIQKVKFLKNGKIECDDAAIFDDLNEENALNLNVLFLQDARKRVYESVKTLIDLKCRNKNSTQAQKIISDIIDNWTAKNAKGEYKEYCAVVPYFFKKYLV